MCTCTQKDTGRKTREGDKPELTENERLEMKDINI